MFCGRGLFASPRPQDYCLFDAVNWILSNA